MVPKAPISLVSKMSLNDAERKELLRIWDAQQEELAEFHGDIGDYLNNEVLEIKREQYLSEGKWTTSKYVLVTGTWRAAC